MKTIADILGVARSNLAVQAVPERTRQRRLRPSQPEAEPVAEIKALIADQPTHGDREAISWVATTGGINGRRSALAA